MFNSKKKILSAITNKEAGVVASLLAKVKDTNETFRKPDNKDVEDWTLALHACKYGNLEIVEMLLKNDSDLTITDSDGKSALYWGACNDDECEATDIVNRLIEESVDINKPANDGRTALVGAVINGNLRAVEALLMVGADPNILMSDGRTSLHITAQQGDIELLKAMLKAGADPNIQENSNRNTPLHIAVGRRLESNKDKNDPVEAISELEKVKALLEGGADPNIQNLEGMPLLMLAIAHGTAGDIELAKALVGGGADVNKDTQTPDGNIVRPLDVAAGAAAELGEVGLQEIVEFLISKGAEHAPGEAELEITIHGSDEEASFYDQLDGADGKYHYELHMKSLNEDQIAYIKAEFDEYTWDMGFAVTKFEFKEDGNLFKIVFDSKKYFDAEVGDWSDRDLAQNIVTRLVGKEQFFCNLWVSGHNFEDQDIVFVDDRNYSWAVEISKFGRLEKITQDQ
jgi:ankyrin repeat protein